MAEAKGEVKGESKRATPNEGDGLVTPSVQTYVPTQGFTTPTSTVKTEDQTTTATTTIATVQAPEDPEITHARGFVMVMVGALGLHDLKDVWNLKPGDPKPANWLEYFEPKQQFLILSAYMDAFPGQSGSDKLDLTGIAKSSRSTFHFGNLVKYHVAMNKLIQGGYQQTTVSPHVMSIRAQALNYFGR